MWTVVDPSEVELAISDGLYVVIEIGDVRYLIPKESSNA